MVDHIHLPRRVGPLFPAEKIKKVKRRKEKQQDSAFKENRYGPAQPDPPADANGGSKPSNPEPDAGASEEGKGPEMPESEKRIDVRV